MGMDPVTLTLLGGSMAIGGDAAAAGVAAWSAYETGKENAENIKAKAQIEADQMRRQAAEQQKALDAQARGMDRQAISSLLEANEHAKGAAEELRQGEIAQEKANIEQLKGEREAAKRSRLLANEIGSQYANYAANGFDVAAGPTDTFGSILKTATAEGQADITTILENANMNKWSFEEEKRTRQRSAASDLSSANASVFKARSFEESAADYRRAGAEGVANAGLAARETLRYAKRAASAQRRSGLRGAIGAAVGGVGTVGKDVMNLGSAMSR